VCPFRRFDRPVIAVVDFEWYPFRHLIFWRCRHDFWNYRSVAVLISSYNFCMTTSYHETTFILVRLCSPYSFLWGGWEIELVMAVKLGGSTWEFIFTIIFRNIGRRLVRWKYLGFILGIDAPLVILAELSRNIPQSLQVNGGTVPSNRLKPCLADSLHERNTWLPYYTLIRSSVIIAAEAWQIT
jgi:hypothetical protein